MHLRAGIPRFDDLARLAGEDLYKDHLRANSAFLGRHGPALAGYGRHWGQDPYRLWSRRWEYPWVAQTVLDWAAAQPAGRRLRVLDAGSGVTYLPYLLCERVPTMEVVAFDYDPSYVPMFAAINKGEGHERVTFTHGDMRKMPFEDGAFDATMCVSVLEHTDAYDAILAEFRRVLAPGGLLALTFDVSLDDKFPLTRVSATALLKTVAKLFEVDGGEAGLLRELSAADHPDDLLTTDRVKATEPDLLPWRYPLLKAAHDLVKGHGWTGGFRSKTVFCCRATTKAATAEPLPEPAFA